jgi:hypothetical protein
MPASRFGLSLVIAALALSCVSGKQPPPPAPPIIKQFSADHPTLRAGEQVTLTWETTGVDSLTLLDPAGTEVALTPTASGSTALTPSRTTFYLLRASGPGGRDSAFVQVAVEQPLREVFLVAIPNEVESGQPVDLIWSAFGGSNITLKDGDASPVTITGQSGVARVQPRRGTTYTLSAGPASSPLSATAQVKVRPVVISFTASPPVAKSGETITLEWATAGFDTVTLEEATFGTITTGGNAAQGSARWTVPTNFPGGTDGGTAAVPNGFPLSFTLTAEAMNPSYTVHQTLNGAVGEGALIDDFKVPANGTEGKSVPLSWVTRNAVRVELLADGYPLYQPAAGLQTTGAFLLPPIKNDTTITLVAYDFSGFAVRSEKKVTLLRAPKALTFVAPPSVGMPSGGAQVSWTTENASLLVIRIKGGPTVFTTRVPAQVTGGNTKLFPARETTYVLEAYNTAGEISKLEKHVAVAMPVTASLTPEAVVPGTTLTFTWDLSGASALEVVGVPNTMPPVAAASTAFVDLNMSATAKTLLFTDKNDGTATFQTGVGFLFPFLNKGYTSFVASTNGFLSLAPIGATPTNANLTMFFGSPLFAPFWDDLTTQDGAVLWSVEGDVFPRRLIVQWDKVKIQGDPTSELTFQVQLAETGETRFVYQTLQDAGTAARGQSATIGIFGGTGNWVSQASYNPAGVAIAEAQELLWFTGGSQTGMMTAKINEPMSVGFFFKTAGDNWAHLSYPVRVFSASTVQLTEVMPLAPVGADHGTWVELYNPSKESLDISGLRLVTTSAPMMGYTFPAGTVIPPTSYWLVGESTDVLENGEAPVKLAWAMGDVPLAASDTVSLRVPLTSPVTISSLTWAGAVAGISYQREAAVGSSGMLTCMRKSMFGPLGATGTPGGINETCFDYQLSAVPYGYEDISGGGTLLFASGSLDDQITTVPLASPFKYFGTDYSVITVSTNGWTGFGSYASTYAGNKTAPSSSAPNGTVSPFWDDLANSGFFADANVYYRRNTDHFIVQWHHYSYWSTTRSDDLNFQVKYFDNGAIEFHYAELIDRVGGSVARGQTATAWIERPSGTAAAPISINSAGLSPHSAWRFTPKP